MTTKPSNHNYSSSPQISSLNDVLIDATLALYAKVEPEPGLESRIADRIAQIQRESARTRSATRLLIWKRLSVGALATAAACGIVVGTVQHSRHNLPPQVGRSTANSSNGAGIATAPHTPTRAIPVSPQIDPNSPRTPAHGRAQISRNPNHHPNGVATPRSPYPPDQQPDSQDKPEQ